MISKKIIRQIKEDAKRYFVGASGCHDWTHIERVRNLALSIGKKEKAQKDILEVAVYLHDIGRKKEMNEKGLFCHAEHGADEAKKILEKYGLSKDVIDNITHCIRSHRYRNRNIPQTIEAKVLYDSDKLDSIGAVGIARAFLFAGMAGSKTLYTGNEKKLARRKKDYSYTKEDSTFLEYEIKLKYIKDKMLTKSGKKMAIERHKYMKEYFERFEREIKAKL